MHHLISNALCTVALAAAATSPVHALTLVSTSSNGNQALAIVADTALPTVSAVIGFSSFAPVSFVLQLGSADVDGLAGFNAAITNRAGAEMPALQLTLDRGSFAEVGSVAAAFGGVASISGDSRRQRIAFSPPEPFGVDIGDPFSAAGAHDWLIGLAGLAAGDRFTLTVSVVPEPANAALLLVGAGFLNVVRRRQLRRASS